jgi:alpha-galactosidase
MHSVVETNAHFSRGQITPLTAGALPAAIAALINRHIANQELIVEAALADDLDLAFQAFFTDPANDLPIDSSWGLFNRMILANRKYRFLF